MSVSIPLSLTYYRLRPSINAALQHLLITHGQKQQYLEEASLEARNNTDLLV
jgi:hypothetical protein